MILFLYKQVDSAEGLDSLYLVHVLPVHTQLILLLLHLFGELIEEFLSDWVVALNTRSCHVLLLKLKLPRIDHIPLVGLDLVLIDSHLKQLICVAPHTQSHPAFLLQRQTRWLPILLLTTIYKINLALIVFIVVRSNFILLLLMDGDNRAMIEWLLEIRGRLWIQQESLTAHARESLVVIVIKESRRGKVS